jgi:hypothetical protein
MLVAVVFVETLIGAYIALILRKQVDGRAGITLWFVSSLVFVFTLSVLARKERRVVATYAVTQFILCILGAGLIAIYLAATDWGQRPTGAPPGFFWFLTEALGFVNWTCVLLALIVVRHVRKSQQ